MMQYIATTRGPSLDQDWVDGGGLGLLGLLGQLVRDDIRAALVHQEEENLSDRSLKGYTRPVFMHI